MSEYTRAVVVSVVEKLHICLARAIDTALTDRVGVQWFEQFKESEAFEEKPIVSSRNSSPSTLDLQACLKILRMRETMAKIIFEYYGHNFFEDNDDAKTARLILNQRLNNLIHNIRNDIYAHAGADMVETGEGGSLRHSVYGMKESVDDMLKIAYFFKSVTDSKGVSYYDMMCRAARVSKQYSVKETIASEQLKIPAGTFVEVCNDIGLRIETDEEGRMTFCSENYEGDIAKIKLYVSQRINTSQWYLLKDVLKKENIREDAGEVVVVCQELSIPVSTDSTGNLVMSLSNYSGDIARVKLALSQKQSKKKKKHILIAAIVILIIAGAVILGFIVFGSGNEGDDNDKQKTESTIVTENVIAVPTEEKTVYEEEEDVFSEEDMTEPVYEDTGDFMVGTGSYKDLEFEVYQLHDNIITINMTNTGESRASYGFGWVNYDIQFFLVTVSGEEHVCTVNKGMQYRLAPGDTDVITLVYSDLDAEVASIEFVGVYEFPNGSSLPSNMQGGEVLIDITYKPEFE